MYGLLFKIKNLWDIMADKNFFGTIGNLNISGPGYVDPTFFPDFVLNAVYHNSPDTSNSHPVFKYNDSRFKVQGIFCSKHLGISKLMGLYKFLIVRKKLLFSWTETGFLIF